MIAHRSERTMKAWNRGALLLMISLLVAPVCAQAQLLSVPHVTDGVITPGEWPTSTSSAQFFPYIPSTGAGGAYLYVDQGSAPPAVAGVNSATRPGFGSTLYLAYDYVHDTTPLTPGTYFDVFFQVKQENPVVDYLVRISSTGIQAYEKLDSTPAPTPGGNFDPTQAPWTPVEPGDPDLSLATFKGALGFGTSPNSSVNHEIAEFQLNINNTGSDSNPNGLYSPDPSFWSASQGSNGIDPPISSAIFTLNPDGTTTVNPIFGPNGGPILQPLSTPEPSSLVMVAAGALGLLLYRGFTRTAA
jgi:hypothetical protein